MSDSRGSGDPKDLAEFELRAKLWAQDGLEGDRLAMEEAAIRALGTAEEGYPLPPALFKECSVGGRHQFRSICVGDRLGDSEVVRDLGIKKHHRFFEVTCGGCQKIQIRSAGALNARLRKKGMVECPACRTERCRGQNFIRYTERQNYLLQRVREGGPIYTDLETNDIKEDVWSALEEEFGPTVEEDDVDLEDFFPAAGWPWSFSHGSWALHYQREQEERMNRALMWKREDEERKRLGRPLAALLEAMESGDADAINQADRLVNQAWPKENPELEPERNVHGFLTKVPYYKEAVESALERAYAREWEKEKKEQEEREAKAKKEQERQARERAEKERRKQKQTEYETWMRAHQEVNKAERERALPPVDEKLAQKNLEYMRNLELRARAEFEAMKTMRPEASSISWAEVGAILAALHRK